MITRARHPRLLVGCWLIADLCSLGGTRLAAIAVPWLVLTTTGSATLTGLAAAAELLPMVITRALSGPVIDRVGAVRTAAAADLVSAAAVVGVPLLWTAGLLSFPALLILVGLLGAARGPGDSAKQTMLPDLATAAGQPLERLAGMGATVERLASTAGLALGGIAVAAVGSANALLITAAGFVVGTTITLSVLRRALGVPARSSEPGPGYLAELREGIRTVHRDRVLVTILITLAIVNGIDQAYLGVIMPAWILERGLGAEVLGLLLAAFMIAAVVGALLATIWSRRLPRLPVYVIAFLIAGAPRFVVLAFEASLPLVLSILVLAGFAAGFINPILSAITLERAPAAVRGRVMALIGATSLVLMPVGGILGGVLVDRIGMAATVLIGAGAYLLATVVPALRPSFRDFGRRPAPTSPPAHPFDAGAPSVDGADATKGCADGDGTGRVTSGAGEGRGRLR